MSERPPEQHRSTLMIMICELAEGFAPEGQEMSAETTQKIDKIYHRLSAALGIPPGQSWTED